MTRATQHLTIQMRYGAFAIAGFCLFFGLDGNAANPAKVAVCHVPSSMPANTQLIEVGSKGEALAAHLSHGDWPATDAICEDSIDDNNCDGNPDTQVENNYNCVIQTGNADATCEDGTCIEPPPPNCRCSSFFGYGWNGVEFPADVDSGEPLEDAEDNNGHSGNCIDSQWYKYRDRVTGHYHRIFVGIQSDTVVKCRSYRSFPPDYANSATAFNSADPLADIQACIHYIERSVPGTNICTGP